MVTPVIKKKKLSSLNTNLAIALIQENKYDEYECTRPDDSMQKMDK